MAEELNHEPEGGAEFSAPDLTEPASFELGSTVRVSRESNATGTVRGTQPDGDYLVEINGPDGKVVEPMSAATLESLQSDPDAATKVNLAPSSRVIVDTPNGPQPGEFVGYGNVPGKVVVNLDMHRGHNSPGNPGTTVSISVDEASVRPAGAE